MTEYAGPPVEAFDQDKTIELAFVAGTQDAMHQVFRRFGGLVYSLCLRSLPHSQAEDATQQVFISAWKNRAQFDPERGSLAAWLTGIAKYRIIDTARSEQRVERNTEAQAAELTAHDDASDAIVEQLLISDAIGHLPDRPAKVLTMSLYDEIPHTEIAERLSLPLGTVKSDIRRGLLHLRHVLEGGMA